METAWSARPAAPSGACSWSSEKLEQRARAACKKELIELVLELGTVVGGFLSCHFLSSAEPQS